MFRLATVACLTCALLQGKSPVRVVVVTAYPQILHDAGLEFEKQFGAGLLDLEAGPNLDCRELERADVLYIHGAAWTPEMQACGPEVRRLQQRGLKLSGTIPAIAQIQSRWSITPNAELYDAEPYLRFGGAQNMSGFLVALFNAASGQNLKAEAPKPRAEAGIYHPKAPSTFVSLDDYLKWYRASGLINPDAPLVGLTFFQSNYFYGDLEHVDALIAALEKRGIGVIPAYGWPLRAAEPFLIQDGHPVIEMLFCLNLLMPSSENANLLTQYGIHAINLMTTTETFAHWSTAVLGLPPGRTALQLGTPERTGATEPILIATTEKTPDGQSILIPVTERVEMAASRAERWIVLRHKNNADKRIALVYFNNPPGKGMLGASYLNLFPSVINILKALQMEGYSTSAELPGEERLKELLLLSGRNVDSYAPGELDALIHDGHATLLPLERYQEWYAQLPQAFRERTEKTWGKPSASKLMIVRRDGRLFFVIPGVKLGNIFLGPQPLRDSIAAAPESSIPPIIPHRIPTLRTTCGCVMNSAPTPWSTLAVMGRSNGCRARMSPSPRMTPARFSSATSRTHITTWWTAVENTCKPNGDRRL
jgi:cobaltochelatase CobN